MQTQKNQVDDQSFCEPLPPILPYLSPAPEQYKANSNHRKATENGCPEEEIGGQQVVADHCQHCYEEAPDNGRSDARHDPGYHASKHKERDTDTPRHK